MVRLKKKEEEEEGKKFPRSPVWKLHAFTAQGTGSIPGGGTKILQVVWVAKKRKRKID